MHQKFRLFRRSSGIFYWQEVGSPRQGSLHTKDERAAELLLNGMNEVHRQPILNRAVGRAYLAAADPALAETQSVCILACPRGAVCRASVPHRRQRVFGKWWFGTTMRRHFPFLTIADAELRDRLRAP